MLPSLITALAASALLDRAAEPTLKSNSSLFDSLPPDLPLRATVPKNADWLRQATILQPYGHSAYVALANPGDRPTKLKAEFGFNVITVQPPDSHNTIAKPADRLSEQQFRAALAAYRAAGFRVIFYTSVMALGLSPEFQSGSIGRAHPDWLQRDPKGNPVLMWGVPWLCPSTGARDAALERCIRIVREYKADGILLDNNEFFSGAAGWTCHCAVCTRAFREYVAKRFGSERSKELFGTAPGEVKIPTEEGPLFALWMHWRNRVWAEVNESFRARLREVNPQIMLFANTQYGFESGMLGTDLQYGHEDVVVSESCNLNSQQMSAKMELGSAMAAGRPLWNYIGTFAKSDDYTGLLPAATIRPMIVATIAHGARPWIVDGFDEGPTDPAARGEMSRLLSWHAEHPQLYPRERWTDVCALISINSRNALHRPLIPPHIAALHSAGTPVIALRDDELTADKLKPFRVVTAETSACLSDASAVVLAKWVRNGGELLAAPETGEYDELGRRRPRSILWTVLGLNAAPNSEATIGQGSITVADAAKFVKVAVERTSDRSFGTTPRSHIEVVPYQTRHSMLLHLLCHERVSGPLKLWLSGMFAASAEGTHVKQYVPGSEETKSLRLIAGPEFRYVELPDVPAYSIIEISKK